eukprot:1158720-Pelagomonas_calceolata.AAC.6
MPSSLGTCHGCGKKLLESLHTYTWHAFHKQAKSKLQQPHLVKGHGKVEHLFKNQQMHAGSSSSIYSRIAYKCTLDQVEHMRHCT